MEPHGTTKSRWVRFSVFVVVGKCVAEDMRVVPAVERPFGFFQATDHARGKRCAV